MSSSRPSLAPRPHASQIFRHIKGDSQSTVTQSVICDGWLLKKRRKKMQGFARRYFVLYQSGLLSYSFEPGKPSRDQLLLPHAAISTYPGRKDIHIDSSNATFHLKCLSSDDFNKWMTAFRKFIIIDGRRSSVAWSSPRMTYLSKSATAADDMAKTITELENAFTLWQTDDFQSKHRVSSKKADKERHKDKDKDKDHTKESSAIFGIFKRSGSSRDNDSGLSETQSNDSQLSPRHRIQVALETLKTQHEMLLKSLHALSYIETGTNPSTARASPLTSTAEEEDTQTIYSQDPHSDNRFSTPIRRRSTRASIATTLSDGTVAEWFDAPDGGEEFILEIDEPTPGEEKDECTLMGSGSTSLYGSSDADEEGIAAELLWESEEEAEEIEASAKTKQVARRTELPSGPIGDEGSLFSVLKKNVGKDLSNVALPVTFNEPLTLLQAAAEQVEYFNLLRQAVEATDSVERMCYVAAFAISGYAHTRHRSGRKSFNPMLAETFEDVRMNFIAEKVQHHPFAMAYHAEGEGWELYATSSGKTKFWGKSLEIIPLGTTHLKIGGDHFAWTKPSSFMRNLMMGTKYLEHSGKLIIENLTTKVRCVLEFQQNGYWTSSNQVSGTVFSSSGSTLANLEGKWDGHLARTLEPTSHLHVLWRVTPFPMLAQEFYGFTSFGITLNEITEDIRNKLPPTDSRFRPDVRALEEGNIDEAEEQKLRLEEMQRERRKNGQDRQPQWFKLVGDEWVFKGGYWEARANNWQGANVGALW